MPPKPNLSQPKRTENFKNGLCYILRYSSHDTPSFIRCIFMGNILIKNIELATINQRQRLENEKFKQMSLQRCSLWNSLVIYWLQREGTLFAWWKIVRKKGFRIVVFRNSYIWLPWSVFHAAFAISYSSMKDFLEKNAFMTLFSQREFHLRSLCIIDSFVEIFWNRYFKRGFKKNNFRPSSLTSPTDPLSQHKVSKLKRKFLILF